MEGDSSSNLQLERHNDWEFLPGPYVFAKGKQKLPQNPACLNTNEEVESSSSGRSTVSTESCQKDDRSSEHAILLKKATEAKRKGMEVRAKALHDLVKVMALDDLEASSREEELKSFRLKIRQKERKLQGLNRDLKLAQLLVGVSIVAMVGFAFVMTLACKETNQTIESYNKLASELQSDFPWPEQNEEVHSRLKSFNDELKECIDRESLALIIDSPYRPTGPQEQTLAPVCFSGKIKWLRHIQQLKQASNFDLYAIVRHARQKFVQNYLVKKYPNMDFELVINQIDYLEHLKLRRQADEL